MEGPRTRLIVKWGPDVLLWRLSDRRYDCRSRPVWCVSNPAKRGGRGSKAHLRLNCPSYHSERSARWRSPDAKHGYPSCLKAFCHHEKRKIGWVDTLRRKSCQIGMAEVREREG